MAELVNPSSGAIEHGADEGSPCTEATKSKGEESPRPEESLRVGGGNCECHLQQANYLPNTTASCDYAPQTDYQPFYQAENYCTCQGATQGYQGNQWPNSQWQNQQWQDCGTAALPVAQCHCQSYAQPTKDCGCCAQPSTHYMEYKGFQHSPKPNPVYVSTGCDAYSMSSRHAIPSGSSCASVSPVAMCSSPKRSTSKGGFAGVKGSFERLRRKKQKQNQYCCQSSAPTRVLSVELCVPQPRRMNNPDRSYCARKPTPVARTCEVRQHALSHVHGTCHPPPKRACPPPSCGRSSSRNRSRSCTGRGKSRASSVCSNPSDYMEKNRYGNSCLKSPIVRTTSCYSGHCCGTQGYAQPRSRSPSCQTGYSKRSCRKPSTCCDEPVRSIRPRSPSCQRPQSGMSKRICRKPPLCSNETLMEEPVKSYRFSCPENRTMTLCPHCQKTMRQRCSSPSKRCTSGESRKCCSKCRPLTKMLEVPSTRCIYRTLCRNLARPKLSPYKAKYELRLCCKEPRCQGGGNEHHNHQLAATVGSTMKRAQKYVGGSPVSPNRTSQRSNFSSVNSAVRYSNTRSSSASHAPGHTHRSRASSEHQKNRTPAPLPAHRQHHLEHTASTGGRDRRLSLMPGREPPAPPPVKRDPRLASKSERDPRTTSSSGRDRRLPSTPGRDSRTPRLVPQMAASMPQPMPPPMASPMASPMTPQMASPVTPQMPPQMVSPMTPQMPPLMPPQLALQMAPQMAPQLTSPPEPRHRNKSPGDELPSSSKPAHRSHKERSQRKEAEQDQKQPHQGKRHSSPKSEHKTTEIAPGHIANPTATANAVLAEQQAQRQANYLGTKINPYYRGTFLNTRSPVEPHTSSSVRPQEFHDHRRERPSSLLSMPPKWTGLGKLQSWVFGEPYVPPPPTRGSAWSWRHIFGRSKKRNQPRSQGPDQ